MIAAALALAMLSPGQPLPDTAPFVGSWICQGRFVRSGRPLSATIVIRRDDIAGTLVVDHRDVPPGGYRSLEIWSMTPQGVRAAIADASGMRWFDGAIDAGRIVFARRDGKGGAAIERFTYGLTAGKLTVDWSHRGAGGTLDPGDTLSCTQGTARS